MRKLSLFSIKFMYDLVGKSLTYANVANGLSSADTW